MKRQFVSEKRKRLVEVALQKLNDNPGACEFLSSSVFFDKIGLYKRRFIWND